MWIKKILTVSLLSVITVSVYAINLNLTLVGPIQFDPLNIAYTINQAPGDSVYHEIDGLKPEYVAKWIQLFNQAYGKITPITDHGKVSQIAFGYEKNGSSITPKSCQNIIISQTSRLNVWMSEMGCKVVKKEEET